MSCAKAYTPEKEQYQIWRQEINGLFYPIKVYVREEVKKLGNTR